MNSSDNSRFRYKKQEIQETDAMIERTVSEWLGKKIKTDHVKKVIMSGSRKGFCKPISSVQLTRYVGKVDNSFWLDFTKLEEADIEVLVPGGNSCRFDCLESSLTIGKDCPW